MTWTVPGRLLALVLVLVLAVTLAAPARAQAMEPTTIITLASLGIGVIAVIGFLIVANIEGSPGDKIKTDKPREPGGAEQPPEVAFWVSCPSGKCPRVILPGSAATAASPEPTPVGAVPDVANGTTTPLERQGP